MKAQQKTNIAKLATSIDRELMKIIMNDLHTIRAKQFLNTIQLKAA